MRPRLARVLSSIVACALLVVGAPSALARPLVESPEGPSVSVSKVQNILEQTATRVSASPLTGAALSRAFSNQIVHVRNDGAVEVLIHARGPVSATQIAALRSLGATVTSNRSNATVPILRLAPFGLVQAWAPPAALSALGALSWVAAVTAPDYGFVNTVGFGSIVSEGVARHNADVVQDPRGIKGAGVNVGIMSNGVEHLSDSQALGELPNTVNVVNVGSGDEGTAILEIVADMAPEAGLIFAGVGSGISGYVNSLNGLVSAGANVIAHDIALDSEPAFQEGLAAQAADDIAAGGVSFHGSSGNRAQNHAARVQAVGTGQTPDGTSNSFSGCTNTPDNVVAIAPGGDTTFDVTLGSSASFTLQWSEPRAIFPTAGQGGFTDLNLYLMNSSLTQCLAESVGGQADGVGDTIEQIGTGSSLNGVNAKLVVDVEGTSSAVAPPLLDLRWRGASPIDTPTPAGSLDPNENMTGLATADGAVYAPPGGILETFSSQGPVTIATTTRCPGGGSGPCTGEAGPATQTFDQPFWVAADGVSVSGVGGFGSPFFGTSASAPHAAACDALLRSSPLSSPNASPASTNARLAATASGIPVPNVIGAGLLDCLAAVNRPPVADAGGPYATIEGTDVTLSAAGSSDPDTGDSIASYSWDLDNDGIFGDSTAASPVFDAVGQDGVYPVAVEVTDQAGDTDTDSTTVTVANAIPTVTAASTAPVDENSPVTLSGVVSDAGWLDPLTATVDWGDGNGAQPLAGVLENLRPDATLTFSVDHTYGDNGTFTAQVCGTDENSATGCADTPIQVDNVDPTALIDTTGATIVNGVPTFIAHAGQALDLSGRSTDPGSDDLTLDWTWTDLTPDTITTSLVNPPGTDPPNSPSIQPRDVTDPESHTFAAACTYQPVFASTDDDAGHGSQIVNVIITGNGTKTRPIGWWKDRFDGKPQKEDFDDATLNCYLAIAGYMSAVFNEARNAATIADAYNVLKLDPIPDKIRELDRELLTAWLNFANGPLALSDVANVDNVYWTFAAASVHAEAVRLNPSSTKKDLDDAKHLVEKFNHLKD